MSDRVRAVQRAEDAGTHIHRARENEARTEAESVIEITDRVVEIGIGSTGTRGALTMGMRSALWLPAFILALGLLVPIVNFGAIFAIGFGNRRPGFTYFSGGMSQRSRTKTEIVLSWLKLSGERAGLKTTISHWRSM
jgi:hypothetical protein